MQVQRVTQPHEMIRSVYGTPGGSYLILESPVGVIPPPFISGHTWLGTVSDMVVALNYHAKQSDIAQSIGVAQQEVSRWAAGTFEPATSFRYEALVREYMTRCLLAPEHQHTLEMYRANAHAGRRKPT